MTKLLLLLLIGAVGCFAVVESGNSVTFNLTIDGKVEVLLRTHATFFFEYPLKDKAAKKHRAQVAVGKNNLTVSGEKKGANVISMEIEFGPPKPTNTSKLANWTIQFQRNPVDNSVTLSNSSLHIPVTEEFGFQQSAVGFDKESYEVVLEDLKVIEAVPKEVSYKCKAAEQYGGRNVVPGEEGPYEARLQMTNTQIQAFLNGQEDFSKEVSSCPDDEFPSASSKGTWSVEDAETNTTCIMFEADMTLKIKYSMTGEQESDWTSIPIAGNKAVVDQKNSKCGGDEQILVLEIMPELTMSFHFSNKSEYGAAKNHFNLFQIELVGDLSEYQHHFKNASKATQTFENKVLKNGTGSIANVAGATVGHSSICLSSQKKTIDENFQIELKNMRAQAFANSAKFLEGEPCPADQKASDIVPIIVGACLAALVVIVLIAYLIGRARAKRHGYSSV